jgi:hypothetical protein
MLNKAQQTINAVLYASFQWRFGVSYTERDSKIGFGRAGILVF